MKDLDLSKLPYQSGRHILVTGGTGGLGREMVERFSALNPSLVIFTGRNQERADVVVQQLQRDFPTTRVEFVRMDLASLADVQHATASIMSKLRNRLDLLICNAGIMAVPKGLSPDGYEIQWATNHLGHALLIKLLLPTLIATANAEGDARVVMLSSEGLFLAPANKGIIFEDLKTTQDLGFMGSWRRYGQSKLANMLYTTKLAQHYPQVSSVAIHPGVVGTDLVKTLGFAMRMLVYVTSTVMTPEDGCKNPMWGATADRDAFENGGYYQPIGEPGKETKWTRSKALAEELWGWTQDALQWYE